MTGRLQPYIHPKFRTARIGYNYVLSDTFVAVAALEFDSEIFVRNPRMFYFITYIPLPSLTKVLTFPSYNALQYLGRHPKNKPYC